MSEHDPHDFEAAEARTAEAQANAARELGFEISDWCWLMSIKKGRRVVRRLLMNAGVYQSSFTPGDALGTAFNEGNRNQGLRIQALVMAHASSDYALMVQEQFNGR